jgi:Domain of unknown function (DUF4186)
MRREKQHLGSGHWPIPARLSGPRFLTVKKQVAKAVLLLRLSVERFLGPPELRYIELKGMNAVLTEAVVFLSKRLGAASPPNDGKQAPFKGPPVFIAPHATATCCRGCSVQWHGTERSGVTAGRVGARGGSDRAVAEKTIRTNSRRPGPRPALLSATPL